MGDVFAVVLLLGVGAGLLWLMSKRFFWVATFAVSSLAAFFTTLASIIHFQILAAVACFLLSLGLAFVALLISASASDWR